MPNVASIFHRCGKSQTWHILATTTYLALAFAHIMCAAEPPPANTSPQVDSPAVLPGALGTRVSPRERLAALLVAQEKELSRWKNIGRVLEQGADGAAVLDGLLKLAETKEILDNIQAGHGGRRVPAGRLGAAALEMKRQSELFADSFDEMEWRSLLVPSSITDKDIASSSPDSIAAMTKTVASLLEYWKALEQELANIDNSLQQQKTITKGMHAWAEALVETLRRIRFYPLAVACFDAYINLTEGVLPVMHDARRQTLSLRNRIVATIRDVKKEYGFRSKLLDLLNQKTAYDEEMAKFAEEIARLEDEFKASHQKVAEGTATLQQIASQLQRAVAERDKYSTPATAQYVFNEAAPNSYPYGCPDPKHFPYDECGHDDRKAKYVRERQQYKTAADTASQRVATLSRQHTDWQATLEELVRGVSLAEAEMSAALQERDRREQEWSSHMTATLNAATESFNAATEEAVRLQRNEQTNELKSADISRLIRKQALVKMIRHMATLKANPNAATSTNPFDNQATSMPRDSNPFTQPAPPGSNPFIRE